MAIALALLHGHNAEGLAMSDFQTQRVLSDIQSHIARLDDRLLRTLAPRTRPIELLWKSLGARFRNTVNQKGTDTLRHSSATPIARNSN